MRRLLVIGAMGMLGQDLIRILHASLCADPDSEWEILGWDLGEIDIQDERGTIAKIEGLQPEIVVNLASFTKVDECESQVEKAFAINAEGMRHVALGALACGAKVVYLSTDYVFNGKKGEPYGENDIPDPLNIYGLSKLKGEQYVRELLKDGLIVRTQWLFGKHGDNFVTSILRQAMGKKELSIVNDQTGSPTYTVDLSRALLELIRRRADGIFHVANSQSCTWHTFGKTILDYLGVREVKVSAISSRELNRPAVRPSYSVLSCQKLEKEIGVTLRPWSEALKDYLRSLKG